MGCGARSPRWAGRGRAESLAGRLVGYWVWPGPDSLSRMFPDVTDPSELVRRHAEAAARFADETGRSPLRHEGFEQYVRRQEAIHEEERQGFQDHPYSWADHLRWYLQSPRREVRGG